MTREDDTDVTRMLRKALTNAVSNADCWGRGGLVIEIRLGMAMFPTREPSESQ